MEIKLQAKALRDLKKLPPDISKKILLYLKEISELPNPRLKGKD